MKKQSKLIITLFLAVIVVLSAFSMGCGKKGKESQSNPTEESVGYEENLGDDIFD